jgi:hypothetical protein
LLFSGANQEIPSAALDKTGQKLSQTLAEKASLQVKSNQLYNRMQTLLEVQKVYIPGVASLEAHFAHENTHYMGKRMVASHVATGILLLILYYTRLNYETYIDDDNPSDHDDDWVDVQGLPRPIISIPAPPKRKTSLLSDGAITLWLPSNIPTRLRSSSCVNGLTAKEIVLRVADCADSLHNIRRCLRELSAFSSFKRKNIDGPGQRVQTRALGTLKALRDKRDRYVSRYRRSRVAWLALDPDQMFEGGKWKKVLRDLKQTDLTFPCDDEEVDFVFDSDVGSEDEDEATTSSAVPIKRSTNSMDSNAKNRRGEGYKRLTWIWRVQKQDVRDIPGLDGSASEEDVYKREIYLYISLDFANVHFRHEN